MLRGRRLPTSMVSVILPVNGDTEHLKASIESLQAQSHANFEVIIPNTSSSRGTRKFLNQSVKDDKRITLINLPKGTPFQKAAEIGVRNATGDYLLFSEPTHIHEPKRIRTQLDYLKKREHSIAVFCRSTVIDKNEAKTQDYLPFSLLIKRSKIPFLFNPYDPRCIRELSSYGKVGLINKNLLTLQKPNARVTTKTHNAVAAFFKTKRQALNIKKYVSGWLPNFRISVGK